MSTAVLPLADSGLPVQAPLVEVVVPVYNEERILASSVVTLRRFLDEHFPFAATITIVDNASTDATWDIASGMSACFPGVRAMHLDRKGRGRAIKAAWTASEAQVLVYVDVDLSTDLHGLLPLVAPLISGHSDLAIGSRLAPGARVIRGPKREAISRCYNLLLHAVVGRRFTDAQCGFKAIRADLARMLLPSVRDDAWFFDTELLVLAAHNGLRIHEVPVDWTDDPDSRVDVIRTAADDLAGLGRLSWSLITGRARVADLSDWRSAEPGTVAGRGAGVGPASTAAYLVLFLCLRLVLGTLAASAVALTVITLVNAAAHWRYTVGGPMPASRFLRSSLHVWLAGLALTTLALTAVRAVSDSIVAEIVAVTASNGMVSIGRFLAVRAAKFRAHVERR